MASKEYRLHFLNVNDAKLTQGNLLSMSACVNFMDILFSGEVVLPATAGLLVILLLAQSLIENCNWPILAESAEKLIYVLFFLVTIIRFDKSYSNKITCPASGPTWLC